MAMSLPIILAELRATLERTYHDRLVRVVLYGSQARRDAESGSDIDVLVVLKSPVQPGEEIARLGPFLTDLSLTHDTLVSCAFVSEERFRQERSPFLMNVRREGVVV
jgi:predicted nucleotidyltransferase